MKKVDYEAIVSVAQRHLHDKRCVEILKKEFPGISEGTLVSIYAQLYQHHTKSIHGSHRKPDQMKEYYKHYTEALKAQESQAPPQQVLLEMAHQIKFSPALFARIILEEFITSHGSLPPGATNASTLVSQWMKNPNKIPDEELSIQVKTCIMNDKNYGPLAENIKHSIGYEHEFLLKEKIEAIGVPYLDERAMRQRGYDKTPDFKLEVPFSIGDYVVNWIESKASFGDQRSHDRYLKDQYWSYQNRFGPGLVIYWYGFVEELDIHSGQGIRLMDHFPEDVDTLPHTLDKLLDTLQCKQESK